MSFPDYAKTVKTALAADWADTQPDWTATLHVDDDYQPTGGKPVVLVADDGGPAVLPGAWLVGHSPRRTVLRLTAFADGRTEAVNAVSTAADFVVANRPGIARVEDISTPLVTRDRETGADLASITMPVIVKQTAQQGD